MTLDLSRMPRALVRRSWQQSAFRIFVLEDFVARAGKGPLRYSGINSLSRPEDPYRPALPEFYQNMVDRGDDGLVATHEDAIVGWAWTRQGPFVEPEGCGRMAFGTNQTVIRFFEVASEFRGQGHGQRILHELTRRLVESHSFGAIVALVGSANEPSRRCFLATGYREVASISTRRVFGLRLASRMPSVK